jgi:hypothetical protein
VACGSQRQNPVLDHQHPRWVPEPTCQSKSLDLLNDSLVNLGIGAVPDPSLYKVCTPKILDRIPHERLRFIGLTRQVLPGNTSQLEL